MKDTHAVVQVRDHLFWIHIFEPTPNSILRLLHLSRAKSKGTPAWWKPSYAQCDEQQPVCFRCKTSLRECSYPLGAIRPTVVVGLFQSVETGGDSTASTTSHSSPGSEPQDCPETPAPKERIKHVVLTGSRLLRHDAVSDLDVERQPALIGTNTSIVAMKIRGQPKKIRPLLPNIFAPTSGFTVTDYNNPFLKLPKSELYPDLATISISPNSKSIRNKHMEFFLRFHQERITSAHYFVWFDYHELHTKHVHAMAESCLALQYSVVAFSALVYSVKEQRIGNELALLYYTMAMKELQLLLNDLADTDSDVALATALQLSSFDVSSPCFINEAHFSASWGTRPNVFATSMAQRVSCAVPHLL